MKDRLCAKLTIRGKALFLVFLLILTASGCGTAKDITGGTKPSSNEEQKLLFYVAAGTRAALEELAEQYLQEHAGEEVKIQFAFNSTGRLLAQIELGSEGDLFVSSEESFMEMARQKELVESWEQVAAFVPAILVPRGNPAGIEQLSDLARDDLDVIICEESAAMGRAAVQLLKQNGLYEPVSENIVARVSTAPQVALSIALRQGDAGITGRNSAGEMTEKVEVIPIPPAENVPTIISFGVLNSSKHSQLVHDFIKYALSPAGQQIFKGHGFGLTGN